MYITAWDGKFWEGEKEYRFIGCNMFELAYVDTGTAEKMLTDASGEGFKAVRFWVFHPVEKDKLDKIYDIAGRLKLKLIPVLADKWGYLQDYVINNGWYEADYKKIYLPHIIDLAESFKDRDEILLWELINEPEAESFDLFYDFIKDAAEKFKSVNSKHLLSVGTIGGIGDKLGNQFSRFSLKNFEKLHSIPELDAVSLHDYSYDAAFFERLDLHFRLNGSYYKAKLSETLHNFINKIPSLVDKFFLSKYGKVISLPFTLRALWRYYNNKDIEIAQKLIKPIYIGETGFKKSRRALRKKLLEADIKEKFGKGVSGYMLWSFEAQGWSQDGHGYGFNKSDGFGEIVKKISQ